MRVETTGVCRGNWKIYQQLKIEGIHKGSSVTAQAATDDNRCLPLSLLKFRVAFGDELEGCLGEQATVCIAHTRGCLVDVESLLPQVAELESGHDVVTAP